MSIALFPSAFHPSLGGVEELSRQLAHSLHAQGHGVMIHTNHWPKTLPAEETFEGLAVQRYCFRVPEASARQWAGAMLYGRSTLAAVCGDLRRTQAEVLHVQCVSSNAWYALKATRRLGLPLVVSLQGELTMDATGLFQHSAFARKLMRETLAHADAITACSAHTLAEAEAFFGKPFGARARVVYNGIRLADFQGVVPHMHGKPYFLAIGRHVPQKGFDVLLRAFGKALQSGTPPEQDLLLAGDGPCAAELRALVNELGIGSRVHFLGRTDRRQTAALFAGCEWFVLPSRHEPQGIVNLEAMACGKPVLATRVGGVPEIVREGETGLLVPSADDGALCAALLRLAHDRPLRESLGAKGLARAKLFDWAAITAQYVEVYQQVLSATVSA